MLIGNEYWGYETNIHIDAFENPEIEISIQQYFLHGNQITEGDWYVIYSDDGNLDQPCPGHNKDYPVVAGARLAFYLGMTLDGEDYEQ